MTTNQTAPVTDEELDQMIWKLERDGMTPKQLSLMRELREVRRAKGEPVAWTWQHLDQWHVTNNEERARDLAWDGVKVIPLYTSPSAPVVPDAADKGIDADDHPLLWSHNKGWNACRAAMLQSFGNSEQLEPVSNRDELNSPVTPDSWIPVSERMPEVGVKVLCFPVEDEPIHASFNGQLWL